MLIQTFYNTAYMKIIQYCASDCLKTVKAYTYINSTIEMEMFIQGVHESTLVWM